MICFPVKPQASNPALSWKQSAGLELIARSTLYLVEHTPPSADIWLPLVGCGNGGLDPADVLPVLDRYLDDRFTLVTLEALP